MRIGIVCYASLGGSGASSGGSDAMCSVVPAPIQTTGAARDRCGLCGCGR